MSVGLYDSMHTVYQMFADVKFHTAPHASAVRKEGSTMSSLLTLGAMIFLLSGMSIAGASGPVIPNTPAGHTLVAWLNAFNSGDRKRIESFDDVHARWRLT